MSSSVKAECQLQQNRRCEDRSWCRILPQNKKRARCEYCLPQALKEKKKPPSQSSLKKATKSHREPLLGKKSEPLSPDPHFPGPGQTDTSALVAESAAHANLVQTALGLDCEKQTTEALQRRAGGR